MSILNITFPPTGMVGVNPNMIYIDTDDSMATVLTAGYLNSARQLYGNVFNNKQMAEVYTTDGTAILEVVVTTANVSLQAQINPGNVRLPVIDGHFANFDGTTGLIGDDGFLPTDATKTRVVMQSGASVIGNLPIYNDITGTIVDSGLTPGSILTNANVSVDSTSMVVDTSYTINNANLATLTLPAVSAVGEVIEITGNSANGWIIAQNAGNTIRIGSVSSTTGAGGSVASSNRYDAIRLKCVTTNAIWVAQFMVGNLTVV